MACRAPAALVAPTTAASATTGATRRGRTPPRRGGRCGARTRSSRRRSGPAPRSRCPCRTERRRPGDEPPLLGEPYAAVSLSAPHRPDIPRSIAGHGLSRTRYPVAVPAEVGAGFSLVAVVVDDLGRDSGERARIAQRQLVSRHTRQRRDHRRAGLRRRRGPDDGGRRRCRTRRRHSTPCLRIRFGPPPNPRSRRPRQVVIVGKFPAPFTERPHQRRRGAINCHAVFSMVWECRCSSGDAGVPS